MSNRNNAEKTTVKTSIVKSGFSIVQRIPNTERLYFALKSLLTN